MKKIIYLVFCLFVLTGCDVNYNVTINKDLTIYENLEIIGDDRFKLTNEYTLDSLYETLKETYSELIQEGDLDNVNHYLDNNNISLKGNNNYNNLEDFVKSNYIKKIYGEGLKLNKNKNIVSISSQRSLDNFWLFVNGMEEDPLIEELVVNIKVPYVITSNNANNLDKKTNTLTWKFNFQDYNKQIEFEFDTDREFVSGFNFKSVIPYIFYVVFAVIIGFVIYKIVKNKNNKNNKV